VGRVLRVFENPNPQPASGAGGGFSLTPTYRWFTMGNSPYFDRVVARDPNLSHAHILSPDRGGHKAGESLTTHPLLTCGAIVGDLTLQVAHHGKLIVLL
jgi:hypothetical protein